MSNPQFDFRAPHPYPIDPSHLSFYPSLPYETMLNYEPYNCQPMIRRGPHINPQPFEETPSFDHHLDRIRKYYS